MNHAPQAITESLVCALLLCGTFLSRSQQVQNKVTTRFNKLIYILFKDVQCILFNPRFRASRNFYLHIYRSQTAVMSADAGRRGSSAYTLLSEC